MNNQSATVIARTQRQGQLPVLLRSSNAAHLTDSCRRRCPPVTLHSREIKTLTTSDRVGNGGCIVGGRSARTMLLTGFFIPRFIFLLKVVLPASTRRTGSRRLWRRRNVAGVETHRRKDGSEQTRADLVTRVRWLRLRKVWRVLATSERGSMLLVLFAQTLVLGLVRLGLLEVGLARSGGVSQVSSMRIGSRLTFFCSSLNPLQRFAASMLCLVVSVSPSNTALVSSADARIAFKNKK